MGKIFDNLFHRQIIKLNIPQDSSADNDNHTRELDDYLRAGWDINHTTIEYQKNGYIERWFLDNIKKAYDESEKRLDYIIEQQKKLYTQIKKNKDLTELIDSVNQFTDTFIDSKQDLEIAIIKNKSFNEFIEPYVLKPAKIPVITYHIEKRSIIRNLVFYTKKWFITQWAYLKIKIKGVKNPNG